MGKISERKKRWIERTMRNDRSYKAVVYNRFFTCLISVFIQLLVYAVLVFFLVYDSALAIVLQTVLFVFQLISLLYIIGSHEHPSTRLNWIILILLLPAFGVPMYAMNGGGRVNRRLSKKLKESREETLSSLTAFYGEREEPCVETREDTLSFYLDKHAEYPAFHTGKVAYYESGEDAFPDMLEAIRRAEKFVLVEYFIIAHGKMWDGIRELLLERAKAGVQVRILYDDFGCMMTLPPDYDRYLESLHENIKCISFNQVVPVFTVRMNNRDHRKMLVVDGKTAFTGGVNLADEYIAEKQRFGYWKDSLVRVDGAAVRSFTQAFFYVWNACAREKESVETYLFPDPEIPDETGNDGGVYASKFCIQPYDDSPLDNKSVGEIVYTDLIDAAKKYVYIFTPYLVLDDLMRSSLCRAALRGVDVRIVTPGIPDKKTVYRLTRANYGVLIRAGVRIYEYSPGFLHAKSMVCDDERAVVGTINLDYRSLYHHFENAVYFSGCQAVIDVRKDCEKAFALSRERTRENVKRGLFSRIFDAVLRVFETLL